MVARAAALSTRETIIVTAERLFALHGLEGVSRPFLPVLWVADIQVQARISGGPLAPIDVH
jgi:hypothetical protein